MRRIGATFASNLDRQRLLDIVVKTAVDGVGADAGRASVRPSADEPLGGGRGRGRVDGVVGALRAAEHEVLLGGQPVELTLDNVTALAHPLHEEEGTGPVSPASSRSGATGGASDTNEQELFHYLAGQAAVSIANVGLHETVERQSVTDELTGLSNRRRFEENLEDEVERFSALRPAGRPRAAGHRRLQARQRHARSPAGRRGAARGRAGAARRRARSISWPATAGRSWPWSCPGRTSRARPTSPSASAAASSGPGGALRRQRCPEGHSQPGRGDAARRGYDARSLVEAADDALYRASGWGRTGRRATRDAAAAVGFAAMGLLDDAIREHLELKRRSGPTRGRSSACRRRPSGPPDAPPRTTSPPAPASPRTTPSPTPTSPRRRTRRPSASSRTRSRSTTTTCWGSPTRTSPPRGARGR